MKIQFIIVGWYYNQTSLELGLKELNENNQDVDVFYSCHKEPTLNGNYSQTMVKKL